MGAGAPPDDDDPVAEWSAPNATDTVVDLDPSEIVEFEADAITPSRPEFTLPGYELGRRAANLEFFAQWGHLLAAERARGWADILHAVRDHLADDGAPPDIADAIIVALAKRAGVKLG